MRSSSLLCCRDPCLHASELLPNRKVSRRLTGRWDGDKNQTNADGERENRPLKLASKGWQAARQARRLRTIPTPIDMASVRGCDGTRRKNTQMCVSLPSAAPPRVGSSQHVRCNTKASRYSSLTMYHESLRWYITWIIPRPSPPCCGACYCAAGVGRLGLVGVPREWRECMWSAVAG